jgi:DNA (cytosine-5)-methyltransferase 1
MKKFNVIEICAGVGGFGLGFEQYGQVLSAVEWDKAAAGVYKYNNPEVEMFCDLTEVRATDLPWDADDLVICGGTPCQAFSVAGKRGSLSDDRGNLALTFNNLCDAIDDLRSNARKEPAIIIWENVCGVLNTDDNAFGCVLGGMAGSDAPLVPVGEQRWTNAGVVVGPRRAVSFRVLDSQYFGVAQRRRRVFAVAIGGARKWAAPEALIPQQKSLPRNPKKGESSVEGSPRNAGASATGTGPVSTGKDPQTMSSICATDSKKYYSNQWVDKGKMIAQGADVYNGEITGETAATVTSATGIANASGPKVIGWNGDVTPKASEDVSVTLRSQQGGEGVGVAHGVYPTAGRDFPCFEETSPTVKCGSDGSSGNAPGVLQNLTVRRLSSVECMRLQGWPDDHCDFKMELELDGNRWKATGKVVKQAEGPKYKQAGNGVTANVAAYIAGKLMDALSK